MIRRQRLGLAAVLGGASVSAASAAVAAATHPWHDAIAEARVDAARSRLDVSMRVDAAHLEAMIATRDRVAFDLEAATPGGRDEPRLAATVRAAMQARFAPIEGMETGPGRAEDRFDLHWLGAELEGADCWLHFEWVAPAASGRTATPRAVQVRATLLIDPAMQQVNTVSVPGFGAARFSADRTDWAGIDLRLPPRTPAPMRVARAGEAGPRVLLLPGPGGPSEAVTALARRLRAHARVEVALWPGCDGEAPPPSGAADGAWADWAAASLRARILAENVGPLHLVLVGHDAERLAARIEATGGLAVSIGSVLVIEDVSVGGGAAAPEPAPESAPDPVFERYRRDLRAPGEVRREAADSIISGAVRVASGSEVAEAIVTTIAGG